MLVKRDYEKALEAWDLGACNITALANALAEVMTKMDGNRNTHCITRLYLSQMAFLAGIGIGECDDADNEARKQIAKFQVIEEITNA